MIADPVRGSGMRRRADVLRHVDGRGHYVAGRGDVQRDGHVPEVEGETVRGARKIGEAIPPLVIAERGFVCATRIREDDRDPGQRRVRGCVTTDRRCHPRCQTAFTRRNRREPCGS